MTCDRVLEALPDYALGTLSETESAEVRRHLRGCASCRADAATLDQGLVMFASVAHDVSPPPELKERVMSVLQEEWADRAAPAAGGPRTGLRWLAAAAAIVALAGALTWGALQAVSNHRSQVVVATYQRDAESYRAFLSALGGKDVRVAKLHAAARSVVSGTAVLYDSDIGQSWVLVLARAPGMTGTAHVMLTSRDGRTIKLFPMKFDERGDGSSWLVTSASIGAFDRVTLTTPDGTLIASGRPVRNHALLGS